MAYLDVWEKTPEEVITLPLEFADKLPAGLTLQSGTVKATEVPSGQDFSTGGSAVIGAEAATISGTQAKVLLKNGTAGRRYRIDFLLTLSDGVTKIAVSVLLIVKSPDARYR